MLFKNCVKDFLRVHLACWFSFHYNSGNSFAKQFSLTHLLLPPLQSSFMKFLVMTALSWTDEPTHCKRLTKIYSQAQSVPAKQYRRTMKWQGMKERIYFDNGGSKFKIEDSIE